MGGEIECGLAKNKKFKLHGGAAGTEGARGVYFASLMEARSPPTPNCRPPVREIREYPLFRRLPNINIGGGKTRVALEFYFQYHMTRAPTLAHRHTPPTTQMRALTATLPERHYPTDFTTTIAHHDNDNSPQGFPRLNFLVRDSPGTEKIPRKC